MIVRVDKSFQKDVSKINDGKIKLALSEIIESVRQSDNLFAITNLKKLTGFKDCYRIKLGNYRIGLEYTKDREVVLIRFLDRKEIYRKWP